MRVIQRAAVLAGAVAMLAAGTAQGAVFTAPDTGDALIGNNGTILPGTNYDTGNPGGANGAFFATGSTGASAQIAIFKFDFSAAAGMMAVGDGQLGIVTYWSAGTAGSPININVYELTGGDFNEATVTYNNYVGTGNPLSTVLSASPVSTTVDSGQIANHGNFTAIMYTVPQATIQKLIDGTIAGLAFTSVNTDGYLRNGTSGPSFSTPHPFVSFTAEPVPEPASLGLLALGGLALLRRKR